LKIQLLALVVFFMLASSTISSVVMAYPVPFDENISEQSVNEKLVQSNGKISLQENQNKAPQVIVISVFEKMGFSGNDKKPDHKATEDKTNEIQNIIHIEASESIGFNDNGFDKKLAVVKELSERKTIMEKIWNNKKLRFTGKYFVIEDQIENKDSSLFDEFYEITDQTLQEILIDFYPARNLPVITSSLLQDQTNPMPIVLVDSNGSSISQFIDISRALEQGVDNFNDFTSVNNPTALLLLVPIVGYIFVRTEKVEFRFYSFRKVSSFALSLILISSLFSFPLSVSSNYWRDVYADSDPLISENYSTFPTDLPNELHALTVSAWVKPDYSNGSPEFTVVSKDKAFVLSINKLVSPEKVAKFSIYDGMKWHSVESTSQIPENWTHLAATFGDSSMTEPS